MVKISKYAVENKQYYKELEKLNSYIEANLKDSYTFNRSFFIDYNTPIKVCCKSKGYFDVTPKDLMSKNFKGYVDRPKKGRRKRVNFPGYQRMTAKEYQTYVDYHGLTLMHGHGKTPGFRGKAASVLLRCDKHDWFTLKNPFVLLNKDATICPACRGTKGKRTTDEWIKRARSTHGDTYSYEDSVYTHSRCRIDVTCREHGKFKIRADKHLKGDKCKKCKTFYFFIFLISFQDSNRLVTEDSIKNYKSKEFEIEEIWSFTDSFIRDYVIENVEGDGNLKQQVDEINDSLNDL